MKHRRLVIPLLLFLSCSFADLTSNASVQFSGGPSDHAGDLKVRIAFPDGVNCAPAVHVSLVSGMGLAVADGFTNSQCEVEFNNVPSGDYRVVLLAHDVESSGGNNVTVESHGSQAFEIKVARVGNPSQTANAISAPLVQKADLMIPGKARKEFDKASEQISKQDWKKALDQLNKAVAIYPGYAEAYNNMGAVYAHLGDRSHEREVLQRAVDLNDHFAAAYVNLARMDIADHDFPSAETRLNKAVSIEPLDTMSLVLLSNVQLMNLKYDEAIATARKVHSMSQAPHAVSHYVAARAFEAEKKPAEALSELQTFLNEEQSGPRADAARKELAALKSVAR